MNSRRGVHVYRVSRTRLLQIKRNFLGRRAEVRVLTRSCWGRVASLQIDLSRVIFFHTFSYRESMKMSIRVQINVKR